MFYSKSTGGFYTTEIHGDNIPPDAVEITSDAHVALLDGQSSGKIISADENGIPYLADPPPLTFAQKVQAIKTAVQAHLDQAAQALNYDDIKTAVTYADEPSVPKFQAEGLALRAWRSQVWASCYSILAEVTAGAKPEPTIAELLAELPALVLPG